MSGPWHPVDCAGRDLTTGRPPDPPGWPSPAAALAAAPVAAWPLAVAHEDGSSVALASALGPGGRTVEDLLGRLAGPALLGGPDEALVRSTPAGLVSLPVVVLDLAAAVDAAGAVDGRWLAAVDRRRDALRRAVVAAGRDEEMEAAVHVAVLGATVWLDPADDTDVEAHVASGAQLWLLTGAVVSALAGVTPDPFEPWVRLLAAGWWPVGPSRGRLVVARRGR